MFAPDAVYCLNLKRRPERRRALTEQIDAMRAADGWPFPGPVWVDAVDGAQLEHRRGLPPEWSEWGAGAWGLSLTLRVLLRGALVEGLSSLLFFEDDAVFCEAFAQRYDEFLQVVPADWECLMLGGVHYRPPQRLAPGLVRCVHAEYTHGFLIRGAAIGLLYQAWQWAGHVDGLMARTLQRRGRTYAPDPWLVVQSGSPSSINSAYAL